MTTAIVKASNAIKGGTSAVRNHLNQVERAREIYLATIKRAEADYFERITRATESVNGEHVNSQQAEPAATSGQSAA